MRRHYLENQHPNSVSHDPMVSTLKDFQLKTVEHVFNELYHAGGSGRFLVADEVGLGKTLVARGIVSKALDHLKNEDGRIDIIYICSNAAIARQNIARLNIRGDGSVDTCRRLTLLPTSVNTMDQSRFNFISFTPGTTFYLKSNLGTGEERALIYHMLRDYFPDQREGLRNLLQGFVSPQKWEWWTTRWSPNIDERLASSFRAAVQSHGQMVETLLRCCGKFSHFYDPYSADDNRDRSMVIGDLRKLLAETCLGELRPKLVILDEFQRFKDLLHSADEAGELAQQLFNYPDAKILLLSATPYKMLSMDQDDSEDHYSDLIETLRFLLVNEDKVSDVVDDMQVYRKGLIGISEWSDGAIFQARDRIREKLIRVMCRTERVGMTERKDSMLSEFLLHSKLQPDDLKQAALSEKVAAIVRSNDTIEFWKSGPYLLNFMKNYDLRKKFDIWAREEPTQLIKVLRDARRQLLNFRAIDQYQEIIPGNARMRTLFEDTISKGLWRLLWLPPSLPYSRPMGNYNGIGPVTKSLVFSSWSMVPDMIAALCSYDAERRMVTRRKTDIKYSQLSESHRPLLRFGRSPDGSPANMPTLMWLLPSPTLAKEIDPLQIALEIGDGKPIERRSLLAEAKSKVNHLLDMLPDGIPGSRVDERWYWAAIAMLDATTELNEWCLSRDGWRSIYQNGTVTELDPDQADEESAAMFREHLARFSSFTVEGMDLGARPKDLSSVIAELALAGPSICSLRALRRVCPNLSVDDPKLLTAAARIGEGFRTLFNIPASIALLRKGSGRRYWQTALRYSVDGNIQALLDEQVHVLLESQGLMGKVDQEKVGQISDVLAHSLSLLPSRVKVEDLRTGRSSIRSNAVNIRCRFALRFGGVIDDKDVSVARADTVRESFNSPFRPFVLASTSVGQEGLDFHTWCHRVVHWNLPSNPVDLEQREGRVHRYKGHAVRKNISEKFGLAELSKWDLHGDPWSFLFNSAVKERPAEANDIIPYWVFDEGAARIERRIPLLPFSKEVQKLDNLKRGLALYRLVFGHPRQEELLAYLTNRLMDAQINEAALNFPVSLAPPDIHSAVV